MRAGALAGGMCVCLMQCPPRSSIRAQLEPLHQSLGDIITTSLDRHAQRGQKLGTVVEPVLRTLTTAKRDDWCRVVDALAPFMKERRLRRLETALSQRRNGLELVVENVADPWNLASLVRSAEALGVQHVHLVESITFVALPATVAHASSRGALGRTDTGDGASRWLSIHRYPSTDALLAGLRERNLLIYSSDCPTGEDDDDGGASSAPKSGATATASAVEGMGWVTAKSGEFAPAVPIEELDFSAGLCDGHRGVALVFGNERRGVSRLLLESSDALFYLPMCGFTQSFNIGVALAMSLSAAIRSGAFPAGSLDEAERIELMARWLLRDVKGARTYLHDAGLEFADF